MQIIKGHTEPQHHLLTRDRNNSSRAERERQPTPGFHQRAVCAFWVHQQELSVLDRTPRCPRCHFFTLLEVCSHDFSVPHFPGLATSFLSLLKSGPSQLAWGHKENVVRPHLISMCAKMFAWQLYSHQQHSFSIYQSKQSKGLFSVQSRFLRWP